MTRTDYQQCIGHIRITTAMENVQLRDYTTTTLYHKLQKRKKSVHVLMLHFINGLLSTITPHEWSNLRQYFFVWLPQLKLTFLL